MAAADIVKVEWVKQVWANRVKRDPPAHLGFVVATRTDVVSGSGIFPPDVSDYDEEESNDRPHCKQPQNYQNRGARRAFECHDHVSLAIRASGTLHLRQRRGADDKLRKF